MRVFGRLCSVLAALAVSFSVLASSGHAADVGQSYLPPPVTAPAYRPPPCFVTFHAYPNGRGPAVTRRGPESVPVIRFLRYPDGFSLNGRVFSVRTSPGASITLFNRRNYRRPLLTVRPGSLVNLDRPVVDSYRLRCPPVAVYVPPPPPPSHPAVK